MARNLYFDILKGIAIILVVVGHAGYNSETVLWHFIYSFHMPLFMIISGWFFYYSFKKRTPIEIIKRRFTQLIIPTLFFSCFFWLIKYPSADQPNGIVSFYAVYIRTLWFLQACFYSTLLFLSGRFIKNEKYAVLYYFLLFIILLLTPDIARTAGDKFLFPCFCVGYYLHKINYQKIVRHRNIILIVFLCAYIILLYFFKAEYAFYSSGVSLINDEYSVPQMLFINVYRLIIGVVGSFSLMLLVRMFYRKFVLSVKTVLSRLGQQTMGIYITSELLLFLLIKIVTPPADINIIWIITYSIVMLVLSYYLTVLFKNLKAI